MQPDNYLLLVDDDEICHFLSRRILADLPFDGDMVEVYDGRQACDRIRSSGRPIFVMLDLRMPGMDGYEFLDVLARGELGEPPPVFITTSSIRPDDLGLLERFPFVRHYFEKPMRKSGLIEIRSRLS